MNILSQYLLLGITHPFHDLQDNSFKQFLFATSNISKTITSRKIKHESSSPICNYIFFFILAFLKAPPDSNWLNSKLVPIKQVETPNKSCSSKFVRIRKVWFGQLAKKKVPIYTKYCTIAKKMFIYLKICINHSLLFLSFVQIRKSLVTSIYRSVQVIVQSLDSSPTPMEKMFTYLRNCINPGTFCLIHLCR